MYVTVHNYEIGEGAQVDVARTAQAFLETVSTIPGFRGYYMIDGGDHRIASVSIFDTPEGVERCDELAVEFVQEQLGGFRLSEVETTEGKVLASLLPGLQDGPVAVD
jgi:hypothetical protein